MSIRIEQYKILAIAFRIGTFHIYQFLILHIFSICAKVQKISLSLQSPTRQTFGNIRKCLILVEIAKLSKRYIQGTENSSYGGLLILCVYTGVWRYLTSMHKDGSPLLLTITLLIYSYWLSQSYSLKIRHYGTYSRFLLYSVCVGYFYCHRCVSFPKRT